TMGSEYTDRVWHRQEPVTPATESFCRKNPLIFPQTFRQLDTCTSRKPTEGSEKCPVPGARCPVPGLRSRHWELGTGHWALQTSSRMCPSFFFLASRYFCVAFVGAISSGTRSTISRPNPSMATYFAGLFVISRIFLTPRSRRICEPVP